ncbi:hypothetical protein REPUB_Repub12eG0217100 [Reevesia pubescens]
MAKAKHVRVKILEQCQVCPPPNTVPAASLIPLTFFDLPWLFFPPAQPLFFYPYPYPTSHFLASTLPSLKHSLSLTLQLFFPFAAHLVLDLEPQPKIAFNQKHCYVSLTFAESNADFHHISGNHPRDVKDFHPLLPSLESSNPTSRDENQAVPLLAVKVIVFPNSGLCIGLAYHHVAADGRTFDNFIKTWASFHRDSSNYSIMPSYDRTVVIDKHGLEAIFLNEWRKKKSGKQMVIMGTESRADDEFADKVRATFVMGLTDIEKINGWIIGECKNKNLSEPVHLSPYVVACAFVWVCLMKSRTDSEDFDDQLHYPCYFGFNAGGLSRLDFPVPATYFGNCVGFGRSEATRGDLMGENGIIFAAKAIGDTVKKLDKALLGEAERWISDWEVFWESNLHIMVVGSPKLDAYETDFGWGRPTKIEEISIDRWGAISLTESRDEKGGIEVGLALPKPKMDAFTSLFAQALKS